LPYSKWRDHRAYVDFRLGVKSPDEEEIDG